MSFTSEERLDRLSQQLDLLQEYIQSKFGMDFSLFLSSKSVADGPEPCPTCQCCCQSQSQGREEATAAVPRRLGVGTVPCKAPKGRTSISSSSPTPISKREASWSESFIVAEENEEEGEDASYPNPAEFLIKEEQVAVASELCYPDTRPEGIDEDERYIFPSYGEDQDAVASDTNYPQDQDWSRSMKRKSKSRLGEPKLKRKRARPQFISADTFFEGDVSLKSLPNNLRRLMDRQRGFFRFQKLEDGKVTGTCSVCDTSITGAVQVSSNFISHLKRHPSEHQAYLVSKNWGMGPVQGRPPSEIKPPDSVFNGLS